jgi:hypothetical protein
MVKVNTNNSADKKIKFFISDCFKLLIVTKLNSDSINTMCYINLNSIIAEYHSSVEHSSFYCPGYQMCMSAQSKKPVRCVFYEQSGKVQVC